MSSGSFCFGLQAEEHKVALESGSASQRWDFWRTCGDTHYIRKSLPPQCVPGIGLTFILSEGGG